MRFAFRKTRSILAFLIPSTTSLNFDILIFNKSIQIYHICAPKFSPLRRERRRWRKRKKEEEEKLKKEAQQYLYIEYEHESQTGLWDWVIQEPAWITSYVTLTQSKCHSVSVLLDRPWCMKVRSFRTNVDANQVRTIVSTHVCIRVRYHRDLCNFYILNDRAWMDP